MTQYSRAARFQPRRRGVLDTPLSRGMTVSYVFWQQPPKRYSKHFRARGRIALSGVGLRSHGPGGGSKRTSFRESARVKRPEGPKVKEKLDRKCWRLSRKTMRSLHFWRGCRPGPRLPFAAGSKLNHPRHITSHAYRSLLPVVTPACQSPAAVSFQHSPELPRPSAFPRSGSAI